MPDITNDITFRRLLDRCLLLNDHNSCKKLELYVAVTRVITRLEEELGKLKLKFPPIGPDPSPIADGDPDGNPSRFFSVTKTTDIAGRLDVATKFHSALQKITKEVETNINELKALGK